MSESLIQLAWVCGFGIFIALCFKLKEKKRNIAIDALLVYATIFVVTQVTGTLAERSHDQSPVLEADKAEFCMRLAGLLETLKQSSSSLFQSAGGSTDLNMLKQQTGVLDEANKALDTATKAEPKKPILRTKQIIVKAESGKQVAQLVDVLGTITTDKIEALEKTKDPEKIKELNKDIDRAKDLHKLTKALYLNKKVANDSDYASLKTIIETNLKGWFKDISMIELAKVSGHEKEHKKLLDEYGDKCLQLAYRVVICFLVVCCAGLVGVITIIVQLFFLSRKVTPEEERAQIAAPGDWGIRTVYGVFIAWLSLEFLLVPFLHETFRLVRGNDPSATTIAVLTASSYIATNGPALVFIWFLAFRKRGIKFLDGVRFRLKSGKLGPVRIVLAGFLTWTAGIPIVLLAGLFAQKYLHSQGSNNPIIPIVLEAARSNDVVATLLFFFTLGVLPALCEETLFRGFLYTSLRRNLPVFPCIVISAALFSLAHLDAGGVTQLFVLGCLFAFVFERTKSLLASMVTHCLWNSGTFTFMILLFGG